MTIRAPWIARWGIYERPPVGRYALASGEDFAAGALLTKNGSDEMVEVTGSDPTDLFAIAAEASALTLEEGFVLVYEIHAAHWFGMMGVRDPVAGDVGTEYGIVLSDGIWVVDTTDTSNTRVKVEAVDVYQNYYLVTVLTAHIQA